MQSIFVVVNSPCDSFAQLSFLVNTGHCEEASEPLAASKAWRDVAPPQRGFARAAQALAPRVARNDNTGVMQRSPGYIPLYAVAYYLL